MVVYRENLHYAQELQKRVHDKRVKPQSYASGKNVWLNSKFIKTKRNCKLEAKFFSSFQVLHHVRKQLYKLELPKKWKIHNVFYMSLLEQDTTTERREFLVPEFEPSNNKEYEMEVIQDNVVYVRESESGHLPGLYYLVSWKGYPEEENTWEPTSAVQYLRKFFNLFHKDHPDKPTTTSHSINTIPQMVRPTVRPIKTLKRKRVRPTEHGKKRAK